MKRVLVIGGAGFIGTNVIKRLVGEGHEVVLLDNLSQAYSRKNLAWLQKGLHPRIRIIIGDVRDPSTLREALREAGVVFHLAAETGALKHFAHPADDFEVDVRGTVNLLEALRSLPSPPDLILASSILVYGEMGDLEVQRNSSRYEPIDAVVRQHGINEKYFPDFPSIAGCSKSAAENYVLAYQRTYGLNAVVLRLGTVYGWHGPENDQQGGLTGYLKCAMSRKPVVWYGDGYEVRDLLFAEDLVQALFLVTKHVKTLAGQIYNIGGGPRNAISGVELLRLIEGIEGRAPLMRLERPFPGTSRYLVCDTRKFEKVTGWQPLVSVAHGTYWLHERLRAGQEGQKRNLRLHAAS